LESAANFVRAVEWTLLARHTDRPPVKPTRVVPKEKTDAVCSDDLPYTGRVLRCGKNDYSDPHLGAWRAYYKALVEAGVYVGANALEVPETGTTVRLKEGKRRVQDGPYAETKEQLAGFIVLELPSIDAALEWAARCPGASIGAVEVRPLAPEAMRRGFTG